MKKPAIPDGTPQWLRTMLEILVGRRKNLLPIPALQNLAFSDPCSQEEAEALYAYVNTIQNSTVAIIDRLDEADLSEGFSTTGTAGGGGGGGGSGTVISVGLAMPLDDTVAVTGTPVTSSGTLTATAVDAGSADALVGWDDSAGKKVYFTFGTGISTTGTVINVSSSGGTVTSVAQTVPVEFSVSGSPITNSGTLAITKVNQNANTVWAGPASGSPAVPTFRALAAADIPGGGFVAIAHGRIAADGSIIWAKGIDSVDFVAEGVYDVTTTVTVGTSSGKPKMSVQVTPSGAAGNGGAGSSPFKGFDGYEVRQTDTTSNIHFQFNESDRLIYALGSNDDDFYIHKYENNFTDAPTQVDADGVAIRVPALSGILSREGGYVWKSGDSNPIVSLDTSDQSVANYGGTPSAYIIAATDDINALTGSGPSGPRIWASVGGDTIAYDPDPGTATLGSAVLTYSSVDTLVNSSPSWFDKDGYLWVFQGGAFKQLSSTAATSVSHTYPAQTPNGETIPGSAGGGTRVAYDSLNNAFYCLLTTSAPESFLYRYSGWTNGVANSGNWEFVRKLGAGFASMFYEPTQDCLFIAHYSANQVLRFAGYPKTLIDIVTMDDTGTPDIGYALHSAYTCFYKSDSTGSYGVVSASLSGTEYLIKISYNGNDISIGSGGAVFGGVFLAHGTVLSTTVARAEIFRSMSPSVRANAQFNIAIFGEV